MVEATVRVIVCNVPGYYQAAHLALTCEGIKHENLTMIRDLDYGRTLREEWERGQGFINVEYDIAPWPTGLREMWNCHHLWCGFNYPIAFGGEVGGSLGCVKFDPRLVWKYPTLARDAMWNTIPWDHLDMAVVGAISREIGGYFHVHQPPVAHVRQRNYGPDNIYVPNEELLKRGLQHDTGHPEVG